MTASPHDGLVMLAIIGLGVVLGTVLFDQMGAFSTTWTAWVAANFEDGAKVAFLNRLPTYMVIAEIMIIVGMAFPWVVRR